MARSILIVDDSEIVRQVVRTFLESKGFSVCGEAADGSQAIEKATELTPDLILLDVAMPGMNGVEAASILKAKLPNTPIVLFTMFSDNVGQSLMEALGVNAVVGKPDGMSKLLECVNNLLGSQPQGQRNRADRKAEPGTSGLENRSGG